MRSSVWSPRYQVAAIRSQKIAKVESENLLFLVELTGQNHST